MNWEGSEVSQPNCVSGAHKRLGVTAVQKSHKVKKVIRHRGFSMRHLKNDIALLELEQPVMLSNKVNLVCLPSRGSSAVVGSKCYITGKYYLHNEWDIAPIIEYFIEFSLIKITTVDQTQQIFTRNGFVLPDQREKKLEYLSRNWSWFCSWFQLVQRVTRFFLWWWITGRNKTISFHQKEIQNYDQKYDSKDADLSFNQYLALELPPK